MTWRIILCLSTCLLFAFTTQNSADSDKERILEILNEQEEAWNNGDIESFMKAYWKSEELKFYSSNGLTTGWEETKENYYKRYPSKEDMGQLTFGVTGLDKVNEDSYFLMGTYSLLRKNDNPTGIFTLIWSRINGQWKIVADMTCAN